MHKQITTINWPFIGQWLLFGFFCVLSLGQLQRIEYGTFPAFYFHDLLIALLVLWSLTQRAFRQSLTHFLQPFPTLAWLSCAWVGGGLIFALIAGNSIVYPLLTLARLCLYLLAARALFGQITSGHLSRRWLSYCLLFFFFAIFYFGVLQYVFLPDTRFLFYMGWDDHLHRLISTIFDPGFTGLLLCFGYLFTQERELFHKVQRPQLRHLFTRLFSLLFLLGVLFTYSRASYLAFSLISILLSFTYFKRKDAKRAFQYLFFLLFFICAVFLLPRPGGEGVRLERTSTITARTSSIEIALESMNSPLKAVLGQGILISPRTQTLSVYTGGLSHAQIPDNWLVMTLIGTGVIGTGLLLYWLVKLLLWSYRTTELWWIALAATLLHGMFNASLTYPFVWIVLLSWGVLTLGKKQ